MGDEIKEEEKEAMFDPHPPARKNVNLMQTPEEREEEMQELIASLTMRIEKLTALLNDEEDAKHAALADAAKSKKDLLTTVKIIVDSALV